MSQRFMRFTKKHLENLNYKTSKTLEQGYTHTCIKHNHFRNEFQQK